MDTKKFIGFGKLLSLLLLFSFSVTARTAITANESSDNQKEILHKADHSFHKNMLQPQVVQLSITSEPSVKPINSGFVALLFNEKTSLVVKPNGQTNELLQDADRCESVSRLLFPFHYFW